MISTWLAALWRPVRKPLTAFAWLLVVVAVFAAGVGIYVTESAYWSFLLVWWPRLVAGTAAVVALGAWWLWWRLPQRQVDQLRVTISDAKARADVEDNFRKTIGQLLGGAAVLAGATFAYLQFTQQLEISRRQLDATVEQGKQQRDAAQALLISNQVAKGFELLGNKDHEITLRLGGIYALEGVMNTSPQYYKPVLEALCAFVRDGTRTDTKETREGPPASDIQAALTVIGRRAAGVGVPYLVGAQIPKANLNAADLSGTVLDNANLIGAQLNVANLSDALLFDANLTDAFLVHADLREAELYNAHLNNAYLNWANLTSTLLTNADLSGAVLADADLRDAKLDNAHLNNAYLGGGANLAGADLSGADLSGARFLTQKQLDQACGENVRGLDKLDPPLDPVPTIKPCPKPADK
jgi:uncharacterized protein YjbI with pentapeptide repeats